MVLGKLDVHLQKNEVGPLSHTTYNINSKLIQELNVRPETLELLEKKQKNLPDIGVGKDILGMSPKTKARKVKVEKRQMGLYQSKELFHSKGNNQQSEEKPYEMEENICKPCI